MLDADNFKDINDSFGHEAGDRVLCQAATLFKQCLRKTDVAGRLGGDEFGILLPNTPLDDAILLVERLRQTMAQENMEVRGKHIQFSMSIGVAEITSEMCDIDDLFRSADIAMYKDKDGNSGGRPGENQDGGWDG
jgi:diguanylate cyclase (GGDEF)-like protein